VAIEAVFTWLFWILPGQIKAYSFPDRLIWTSSVLPWRGGSSHNPMILGVHGNIDLTEEELENAAALAKENQKKSRKQWHKNYPERVAKSLKASVARTRESKKHWCGICKWAAASPAALRKHLGTKKHERLAREGEKNLPFACDVCEGASFPSKRELTRHKTSGKHQRNVVKHQRDVAATSPGN